MPAKQGSSRLRDDCPKDRSENASSVQGTRTVIRKTHSCALYRALPLSLSLSLSLSGFVRKREAREVSRASVLSTGCGLIPSRFGEEACFPSGPIYLPSSYSCSRKEDKRDGIGRNFSSRESLGDSLLPIKMFPSRRMRHCRLSCDGLNGGFARESRSPEASSSAR